MQSDQADKPLLPKAGSVWYFAYGSNMRSSVMSGRSIIPQKTAVARIPTHVLTFDIFGFPYSEPSFVSIAKRSQVTVDTVLSTDKNIPFESLPVRVVAYLISQEEHIRLVISEGGGVAYREIDVEAEFLYSSEEPIQLVIVSTLEAKYPFRPNAAPSARYLVSLHPLLLFIPVLSSFCLLSTMPYPGAARNWRRRTQSPTGIPGISFEVAVF